MGSVLNENAIKWIIKRIGFICVLTPLGIFGITLFLGGFRQVHFGIKMLLPFCAMMFVASIAFAWGCRKIRLSSWGITLACLLLVSGEVGMMFMFWSASGNEALFENGVPGMILSIMGTLLGFFLVGIP